ncbi:MAG: hypothetical protein JNL49_11140 [Bacteroidia bacterium]|nr:hypothetical protein [Bacteroidia bacterium]
MRIESDKIPQADVLENVILITLAVANGARTDAEIISDIPSLNTTRQGRYYRLAAVLLGFIRNSNNNASILPLGIEFVKNPTIENPILVNAVLKLDICQKVIPYLELRPNGVTRSQLIRYIQTIAPNTIGDTMIDRRVSTIISWLKTLNIVEISNQRIRLNLLRNNTIPVLEIEDDDQPLLPSTGNLREYDVVESRISDAASSGIMSYYKDAAKLERANSAHKLLVDNVANRIKNAGAIPKSNRFVDLATTLDKNYIFEMKSTTSSNHQSQIRKGISQLYEYRYLQAIENVNLVLVIENPLTGSQTWLTDYLANDREILLVWDGNGSDLFASQETSRQLSFLDLIPV